MFMKPSTALGDPWPTPTLIPKISQKDGTSDFESELAVILGKDRQECLGGGGQWRPTLVSKDLVPDPTKFKIRGSKNGKVMQESELGDLIFGIPQLIAFLSQGTTLLLARSYYRDPAGVGMGRTPKEET
ncbi:Fumarylacetoacetate hydrolase domain-containing protein 2 [Fusarium oxysporum f. sp. conglutinans]|nr:Fumarylacetoacetate hydrolase domain-containing protein 2 [Fusarium oxysporum f. sp. conglutinans]